MSVRYRPDYAGMSALLRGEEMQAMLREVAERGEPLAIAEAPVRTGEYKSRFSVTVTGEGGVHHDRAEARIVNDSPHSVLVEWVDDFHTLRDVTETLGSL